MVLIAGGQGGDSAELYDSNRNQSILLSGRLTASRRGHGTVLLRDGGVLLAGGDAGNGHNLESAEVFNPFTQTFSATAAPMLLGRVRATLRILPDGKVQAIGGNPCGAFGDVQIKEACLSASGNINVELCLLCPDGSGGFVDPYVRCPTITLTPEFLAQGTTGQPYNEVIYSSAIGLNTFSLVGGALPGGLPLGADGRISGTPKRRCGGWLAKVIRRAFFVCRQGRL